MTVNDLRFDRYPARVSIAGSEVSKAARVIWTADTVDLFERHGTTARHLGSYTVTGEKQHLTIDRRGRQVVTGAVAIPTSAGMLEVSEKQGCGCGDPVKGMGLKALAALIEVAA